MVTSHRVTGRYAAVSSFATLDFAVGVKVHHSGLTHSVALVLRPKPRYLVGAF